MAEHLGYEKHAVEGRDGVNSRNGTRTKTVPTDIGPVEIEVPRDRDGSFSPQTVRKRQRRLEGVDSMVISLSEEMAGWLNRPLDRVYPVIFIDAIHVKVRDGQVANRALYCVIGVTVEGKRDILGIWASPGAEGAKFWLSVLTEAQEPDAIGITWPDAIAQTCVLHLIRNTFRFAGRQHWDAKARDLRPTRPATRSQRLCGSLRSPKPLNERSAVKPYSPSPAAASSEPSKQS